MVEKLKTRKRVGLEVGIIYRNNEYDYFVATDVGKVLTRGGKIRRTPKYLIPLRHMTVEELSVKWKTEYSLLDQLLQQHIVIANKPPKLRDELGKVRTDNYFDRTYRISRAR
jgi:hypothetical protein